MKQTEIQIINELRSLLQIKEQQINTLHDEAAQLKQVMNLMLISAYPANKLSTIRKIAKAVNLG